MQLNRLVYSRRYIISLDEEGGEYDGTSKKNVAQMMLDDTMALPSKAHLVSSSSQANALVESNTRALKKRSIFLQILLFFCGIEKEHEKQPSKEEKRKEVQECVDSIKESKRLRYICAVNAMLLLAGGIFLCAYVR